MLDLEKREFAEKMNSKIKIPQVIVKLSNTYYSKLSIMAKSILKDGNI